MTINNPLPDQHDLPVNPHQQDKDNLFAALDDINKLKPFVSFAAITAPIGKQQADFTPASGQAIIVYVVAGEATYSDSTGKRGTLKQGGWCWIISGSGIWYSIEPTTPDFHSVQLRIALTPALENSPPQSAYLEPELVAPSQLLLGWHGRSRSKFACPSQVNYLIVRLNSHQDWDYELPLDHKFAWVAVISGEVTTTSGKILSGQIKLFNRPITKIEIRAHVGSILAVGSSMEFGYDLTFHDHSSIHTAREALKQGLLGIAAAALPSKE
jgi:redox-sensitive bicupin YhaK (pirin superfamily)